MEFELHVGKLLIKLRLKTILIIALLAAAGLAPGVIQMLQSLLKP